MQPSPDIELTTADTRTRVGVPFADLPLVAVIITNYNYANYVELAISSVRRQTYPGIECVIVDDCSQDASLEIINRCIDAMADARFRAIRLPENSGQLGAMKAGMELTTGPFVVFLDSDDVLLPDFVQRHVEAHLNGGYSAGITASDTIQIDGRGQMRETTHHALLKHRSSLPAADVRPIAPTLTRHVEDGELAFEQHEPELLYVDRAHDGGHVVATSALMFRRDTVDCVMPLDTSAVRICADYYLVTYIHRLVGTITIGATLSCYRLHGRNHFSNHPVLGGPTSPGYFAAAERDRLNQLICDHMVAHAGLLQRLGCLPPALQFMYAVLDPAALFETVRKSPDLRKAFGRGSGRYFDVRFGTEAFLYRRMPFVHRTLIRGANLLRRLRR